MLCATFAFAAFPASRPGDLPRLSEGPYEAGSNVTLFPRPRAAVSLETMAFSMLAMDVMSCRLGPGDVPVAADAYVVGGAWGLRVRRWSRVFYLGYVRFGM